MWGSIISSGGDVQVTGQGGNGSASSNDGVNLSATGFITAGGSGKVTVSGTGGEGSGTQNCGIESNGTITSGGGDVLVIGQGEGLPTSGNNPGINLFGGSMITAGGLGNVTVQGTGGSTAGGFDSGINLISSSTSRTSDDYFERRQRAGHRHRGHNLRSSASGGYGVGVSVPPER